MSTFQIDTNRLLELASTSPAASQLLNQYYPEVFTPVVEAPVRVPVAVENAVDLSTLAVRNKLLYLGTRFFGAINQSPIYVYTNKAIIVDSSFIPSLERVNGRDLIVFEKK